MKSEMSEIKTHQPSWQMRPCGESLRGYQKNIKLKQRKQKKDNSKDKSRYQ